MTDANAPDETDGRIDVYRVGILSHWHHGNLRASRRYLVRQLRARNFRAVKQHFNGYLAETYSFPPGVTRCGSGWTRRRALRSLARQYRKAARHVDMTEVSAQ